MPKKRQKRIKRQPIIIAVLLVIGYSLWKLIKYFFIGIYKLLAAICKGIKYLISAIRKYLEGRKEAKKLSSASEVLDKKSYNELKKLATMGKIKVQVKQYNAPYKIKLPQISSDELKDYAEKKNAEINEKVSSSYYKTFAENAFDEIQKLIAPNIIGFEKVKQAVTLQLFSSERIHILLIGDPGTGKTDIIRSASELHPISAFGLGSGTTGAGLAVTLTGKEVQKGLLAIADNGICCLDELNLLKEQDRASLYNAMEKGFITYDKKGEHLRFDARVRVLATANPHEDQFSTDIAKMKKQLPFDSALLTRFNLVFIMRKPTNEQFIQITRKILEDQKQGNRELDFIRGYISYSEKLDVTIPKSLHDEVAKFVEDIKEKERNYLVEVSPRLVIGIQRLIKASARISLRQKADATDFERVKAIVRHSLETQ